MPAPAIITSRANPRVKQLRAALAGNARLAEGLIAIEGEHLISEALRSNIALKTIFVAGDAILDKIAAHTPTGLPRSVEVLHLSADVFASVSSTEAPQGIAALLTPPELSLNLTPSANPLLLIAAGLQDPGNLGTLIRSAEAFSATGVLTTHGTVSPWNQKALRASAGSVFRMPVKTFTTHELAQLRDSGIRLLAAVASGGLAPEDAGLDQPCALMIGNEGAGLDAELLALADVRITLPTPGPVESLNAAIAGSLLLYEASRQRTASYKRAGLAPRTLHLVPAP